MNTNDFITSDLHFWHKNILRFNPDTRPFTDPAHMTQALIDQWNQFATSGGNGYHLGDFSFGSLQQTHDILDQLKGNIIFIRGNHDQILEKALKARGQMSKLHDYMELKFNGNKVCLFHYPQVVWNRSHHGSIQLHGHCHGSLNYMNTDTRRTDVGYDSLGRIMLLSDVISMTLAKAIKVVDHHGPTTGG